MKFGPNMNMEHDHVLVIPDLCCHMNPKVSIVDRQLRKASVGAAGTTGEH